MENSKHFDFMTSVDFTYKNQNGSRPYHLLYGSQLYNTLFAIYGKFIFDLDATGAICYLQRIDFKLVNYKGTVNIGFAKEDILSNEAEDQLYVFVQGLRRKTIHGYAFKKPMEIERGNRCPLVINRILNPLKGETFDVDNVASRRITSRDYEMLDMDDGEKVFDNEFKYRDGLGYLDRPLQPGMLGYEKSKETKDGKSYLLGSPRCHQSNVMLKF